MKNGETRRVGSRVEEGGAKEEEKVTLSTLIPLPDPITDWKAEKGIQATHTNFRYLPNHHRISSERVANQSFHFEEVSFDTSLALPNLEQWLPHL